MRRHPVHAAISLILLNHAVHCHTSTGVGESIVDGSCTNPKASATKAPESEAIGCVVLEASPVLLHARGLKAPVAVDTQGAEFEHASFWDDNGPLLRAAWQEWDEHIRNGDLLSNENNAFIEPRLSSALDDAFDNPAATTEDVVKSFWTETSSEETLPRGVYAAQVLTPSGILALRKLLDSASSSGIPTRRPNGMNRRGVIVDPEVYGAVNMKSLSDLVEGELIDRVVRPVGRMLFPDRVGCTDDVEYFAFTIRYGGGDDDKDAEGGPNGAAKMKRDFELKEHRDASVITLNINLNLPEEDYSGSQVYFRSSSTIDGQEDAIPDVGEGTVRFTPGMAVVHLGAHRHGALPISASGGGGGKRYNLVIWLFGKDGDVRIAPYEKGEQMSAKERWRGCNSTRDFSGTFLQ